MIQSELQGYAKVNKMGYEYSRLEKVHEIYKSKKKQLKISLIIVIVGKLLLTFLLYFVPALVKTKTTFHKSAMV